MGVAAYSLVTVNLITLTVILRVSQFVGVFHKHPKDYPLALKHYILETLSNLRKTPLTLKIA